MKIGIGNDHSALDLKKVVVEHLQSEGYEVVDYGTYTKGNRCRRSGLGRADLRDRSRDFVGRKQSEGNPCSSLFGTIYGSDGPPA